MTVYTVSSGQVFTSNLSHTATANVLSGGETLSISDGGLEVVSSGGFASATTIVSGGELVVSAKGSAYSVTISRGGTELLSGGLTSGVTVLAGGLLSGEGIAAGSKTTEQ